MNFLQCTATQIHVQMLLCTAKNTKEGFLGRINHKHQNYTNCHFTHVHVQTYTHFQIQTSLDSALFQEGTRAMGNGQVQYTKCGKMPCMLKGQRSASLPQGYLVSKVVLPSRDHGNDSHPFGIRFHPWERVLLSVPTSTAPTCVEIAQIQVMTPQKIQ